MSKKIHKSIIGLEPLIADLSMTGTDINGMLSSGCCNEMSTVLLSEDETFYDNNIKLLQSDSNSVVTKYKDKKAYVIPGSSITLERLKITCKEHDIKITTNITDAELFITNDHVNGGTSHDLELPLNKIMFIIQNGYSITKYDEHNLSYSATPNRINEWMKDTGLKHVLYNAKNKDTLGCSLHDCEYESLPYDTYVYTGLALEIIHRIVIDGLETIDEDRLISESPNQQILTKPLLDQLTAMWNGDHEDRKLLNKILPTIRGDVNHHYVWELCNLFSSYDLPSNRDKDLKYWLDKIDHYKYNNMSPESFIIEHHEAGDLTSEGFKFVEPRVREDISIHNRELYTFKVGIKPEYLKYKK